jgi:hypothetical protein
VTAAALTYTTASLTSGVPSPIMPLKRSSGVCAREILEGCTSATSTLRASLFSRVQKCSLVACVLSNAHKEVLAAWSLREPALTGRGEACVGSGQHLH